MHTWGLWLLGEYAKAVEINSFISNHPVSVSLTKRYTIQQLDATREHLDEDSFVEAYERGKLRTLKDVVDEAIAYWTA